MYCSTKSEITCNINCLQVSKFDAKHYMLHMWNIKKNLVRDYCTLTDDHLE